MNTLIKKLLHALFCCGIFLMLLAPQGLEAQALSRFHFSVTAGYEVMHGYAPGYDFTILYNSQWGVRYVTIPEVHLVENTEIIESGGSFFTCTAEGDLKLPMILRTIDFRSFGNSDSIPLDFVTAYAGVGYGDVSSELTVKRYTASGSDIVVSRSKLIEKSPTTAVVIGLYFGERFIVVDGKVLYFRGYFDLDQPEQKQVHFDHWLMQLSIGVFF